MVHDDGAAAGNADKGGDADDMMMVVKFRMLVVVGLSLLVPTAVASAAAAADASTRDGSGSAVYPLAAGYGAAVMTEDTNPGLQD